MLIGLGAVSESRLIYGLSSRDMKVSRITYGKVRPDVLSNAVLDLVHKVLSPHSTPATEDLMNGLIDVAIHDPAPCLII